MNNMSEMPQKYFPINQYWKEGFVRKTIIQNK